MGFSLSDILTTVFFLPAGATKAANKGAKAAGKAAGIIPKQPDLGALQQQIANQDKLATAQATKLSQQLRARRAVQNRGGSQALLFSGLLGTRQTLG